MLSILKASAEAPGPKTVLHIFQSQDVPWKSVQRKSLRALGANFAVASLEWRPACLMDGLTMQKLRTVQCGMPIRTFFKAPLLAGIPPCRGYEVPHEVPRNVDVEWSQYKACEYRASGSVRIDVSHKPHTRALNRKS